MIRVTTALAAMLVAGLMTLPGRAAESALASAAFAWERGDYVTALTTYLEVLASPDAGSALETIALQTGEWYRTTEITADGSSPRFSPQGEYVSYETGPAMARVTRVVAAADLHAVAELAGRLAAFSPDGSRVAYVRNGQPVVILLEIGSGAELRLETGTLRLTSLAVPGNEAVVFTASSDAGGAQIYTAAAGREVTRLTSDAGDKTILAINTTGTALLYAVRTAAGRGVAAAGPATFGLLSIADGRFTPVTGSAPSFSRDGRSFTYVAREGPIYRLMLASVADPARPAVVREGPERIDAPALSPDGTRVAFQVMPDVDWEIRVIGRDGTGEARVTRDIQHDVLPKFLTADRLIAATGEPRHRRASMYELGPMTRTRLFHNNTVRTIAPEYEWIPNADGTKLLIVSERDGDTVSPQRGIYLVDLARTVTADEVRRRLTSNLDAERSLRARGRKLYAPIAAAVRRVVAEASTARVYSYEKRLYDFDSKHVTQPGNKLAADYLFETYQSFGYTPEYQRFEYKGRGGDSGQTANVLATLKGTTHPELVYVVSSHYDSVAIGPGADDDSSGTAALLETARILAGHPQPATIVFASFTGEEAGLLGSREFVRRAVADKVKVVGALNNDMIGWANDYRLDNTIRYSNAGIRDVQHAAAMQFTSMITYDALYYKSTDAAAYYEAYGDIVGGIGSYPVLSNPHYHQSHDYLDTINHQLVTEVAKTTAATLMLLAASPSRLTDLQATEPQHGRVTITWTPSPEKDVTGYLVSYGAGAKPIELRVTRPAATLAGLAPGTVVQVKAVNAKGLEGWDWARIKIGSK